jgi:hypothetical protein
MFGIEAIRPKMRKTWYKVFFFTLLNIKPCRVGLDSSALISLAKRPKS